MVDALPSPPAGRSALFGMTDQVITAWMTERGHKTFRAKQVLEWVYRHGARSFDEMTNLPKTLRSRLADSMTIYDSQIVSRRESPDGVVKLLLRWADGQTSECVLIPEGDRLTACLSTQVGCPVGCVFLSLIHI